MDRPFDCRIHFESIVRIVVASAIMVTLPSSAPLAGQLSSDCDLHVPKDETACHLVEVPEDHHDPDSRRLRLRVLVIPAVGVPALKDPVFVLAGGPGQAATQLASSFEAPRSPALGSREIVLIDQRGAGGSNPLSCSSSESLEGYYGRLFPPDSILQACLDEVWKRAEPALYTTTQAAHDIEAVRRALGYGSINLSGTSYGTRLAMEYVRRYPGSVRTMTLSGVSPVDFRAPLEYARLAQAALQIVFEDCDSDERCSDTYPLLDRAWAELLDGLESRPVRVPVLDGQRLVSVPYGAADLAYTVRTMLYGPQALDLPHILYEAWNTDDLSELAGHYGRRSRRVWDALAMGLHLSVVCSEDVPFIEDDELGVYTDHTYLGSHVVDEYRRACEIWPRGDIPEDFLEPVRALTPTLMVSGRRDPTTPPSVAERVGRFFTNAVHLIHPWGGHGFQGTPDVSCEATARETLLRTGSTASIDVACAEDESPRPFRLPSASDGV